MQRPCGDGASAGGSRVGLPRRRMQPAGPGASFFPGGLSWEAADGGKRGLGARKGESPLGRRKALISECKGKKLTCQRRKRVATARLEHLALPPAPGRGPAQAPALLPRQARFFSLIFFAKPLPLKRDAWPAQGQATYCTTATPGNCKPRNRGSCQASLPPRRGKGLPVGFFNTLSAVFGRKPLTVAQVPACCRVGHAPALGGKQRCRGIFNIYM